MFRFAFIFLIFTVKLTAMPPDTLRVDSLFSIKIEADFLGVDAFNRLYLAERNGEIIQLDSTGNRLPYRYSNNRFGAPTAIDVSNPMKKLLFFKDYQAILFLDRTLTENGFLELQTVGIGFATSAALAQDGSVWLYDQIDFSLKNISPQGEIIHQSPNLNTLLNRSAVLEKIVVDAGRIYAWDADFLYVFDSFGQYQKHIPMQAILDFFPLKNGFLTVFEGELVQFDAFFAEVKSWKFEQEGRLSIFPKQKRLIAQTDKALTVFSW